MVIQELQEITKVTYDVLFWGQHILNIYRNLLKMCHLTDKSLTKTDLEKSVYDVYKWPNGEQHLYILGQETRSRYCPDSKHNIVRRETIGRPICEYSASW